MRLLSLPKNELFLRVGVAFSFLYPPISAFFDPDPWIGYVPPFLLDIAGANDILLLHAFGIVEIAFALWILFGKRVFIPSTIAALMLAAIVLVNPIQFTILFRDISIALAAAALAFMRHGKTETDAYVGVRDSSLEQRENA